MIFEVRGNFLQIDVCHGNAEKLRLPAREASGEM